MGIRVNILNRPGRPFLVGDLEAPVFIPWLRERGILYVEGMPGYPKTEPMAFGAREYLNGDADQGILGELRSINVSFHPSRQELALLFKLTFA